MIKKLNDFKDWMKMLISSIIGVLSGIFIESKKGLNANFTIVLIVTIIMIIVLSKIGEFLSFSFIDNSVFLRKLILRKHFIEGFWVEAVFSTDKKEIVLSAIIKIFYESNSYSISGERYDKEGSIRGEFLSKYSEYRNYKLFYAYEGLNSEQPDMIVVGNAEFHFTPSNKKPESFTGFLVDNYHGKKVMVIAKKIPKGNVKSFNGNNQKDKYEIVRDYLNGLKV